MNITVTTISVSLLIFGCARHSENAEARRTVNSFKNYVDSICFVDEGWRFGTDSEFEEVPFDTNDLSKYRIDTIVTKNQSLLDHSRYGEQIKLEYNNLLKDVQLIWNNMNDSLKREFEDAKKKFESIRK